MGDRQRYEDSFELPVRSVRLTASTEVIDRRLQRRYTERQQSALDWYRQRHADLTEALVRADLDERTINTDTRQPRMVAEAALGHFGLLTNPPGNGSSAL